MKNYLYIFLFLLLSSSFAGAQGVSSGLLRAQGTLAMGLDLVEPDTRYYVYGDLEYMPSDHIGIDGAILLNFGSSNPEFPRNGVFAPSEDMRTHHVFFGPNYHFKPNQPLDFFVGFQPGMFVAQIPENVSRDPGGTFTLHPETIMLGPSVSVNGGIAYYGSFFHLFGHLRAVAGRATGAWYNVSMVEFMPTFGLGFNIDTHK